MGLSSRLLAILIICLVALALPAAPVQADGGGHITLSPNNGVPGIKVTVSGFSFTAYDDVTVYYYRNDSRVKLFDVAADEDGEFEKVFTVPESYTGSHKVRAQVTTSIYADADFTVEPGLTVEPDEGPVGTNVTVKGHGFVEDEEGIKLRYYLDGNYTLIAQNIAADEYGSWQRVFLIPPSAQGSHTLDAEGDDNTLAQVEDATFEVTPWIVLDKSSGSPGDVVTATGTGFVASERDIRILFGAQGVQTTPEIIRANATGYWQASFHVPEGSKGTYKVDAEGEYTDKADVNDQSFEIKPGLVLPAAEGYVGMNLTVIGSGFAASKDVDVKYDGNKVATGRTSTKGSFNATFELPESQSGERLVTAEVDGKVEASAVLTMESNAPGTPELVSPAHRTRLGIVGNVRPTFTWSAVTDPSGVWYELQIAATANTTTVGLAAPLISKTRITATSYTLNETEALPYGTYYWVVRAVDRAGNAGRWTGAYSFRVGFMPLWAFIASIVGVLAIIVVLVYLFVIRRRTYYY